MVRSRDIQSLGWDRRGGIVMTAIHRSSAFLLLVALIGCTPDRRRPEHQVVGANLSLRGFSAVADTGVFRADLMEEGVLAASSSYEGKTHNLLFVEASGAAR